MLRRGRIVFYFWVLTLFVCFVEGGFSQEVVDYRAILERASGIMATQTMTYERSTGTGFGKKRMKALVYQLRGTDGTVCRRDDILPLDGRLLPKEQWQPGFFTMRRYYTEEGYTKIFLTRNHARGIRMQEGIPRVEIPRESDISGMEREVNGVSCWVIRVTRKGVTEGAPAVEEYVVEKSTHVICVEHLFDAHGRQTMVTEYDNFNFAPELPGDCFQLPKLDALHFVKGKKDYVEANAEVVKECLEEVGEPSVTRQSQESWLARRWRAICRNPGRAAFWGLLVASCLCLGTAGVLRRGR